MSKQLALENIILVVQHLRVKLHVFFGEILLTTHHSFEFAHGTMTTLPTLFIMACIHFEKYFGS